MARDISSVAGYTDGGTTYTVSMPPTYAAGDVLVHQVSTSYISDVNISGGSVTWTKYHQDVSNSYNSMTVFWCVAGSSSDTPPTVTVSNARTCSVLTTAVRGADTTAPFQDKAFAHASNVWELQTPALASVTANSLLLHSYHGYGSAYGVAPLGSILRNRHQLVGSPAFCAAIANQRDSGAAERDYWWTVRNTANVSAFVLAIKNATSLQTGAQTSGFTACPTRGGNRVGGAVDVAYGPQLTARAPNYFGAITEIDGLALDSANLLSSLQAASDWHYGSGLAHAANLGAPAWCGGWWELAATLSLTGKLLPFSFFQQAAYYGSFVGAKGVCMAFRDSNNNMAAFSVMTLAEVSAIPAKPYNYLWSPETMTPLDTLGTIVWSDITHVGWFLHRPSGNSNTVNFLYNTLHPSGKSQPIVVTGKNLIGLSVSDIHKNIFSNKQGYFIGSLQANVQEMFTVSVQLGDGTHETRVKFAGQSFAFPAYDAKFAPLPSNVLAVIIKASATDVIDVSAASFTANTRQDFTIHADSNTGASYSFAGTSFIGFDVVWKTGVPCASATFSDCYTIDGKAQKFNADVFGGCLLTSAAYLRLDGGADTSNKSGAVGSTFTKGGETYAVELRTAGYYDFTDTTFSGYTNELYISGPAGTYTITLAVGQTQPDVYNPNSRTIVWDVPTVNVTFGPLAAGSQVIVFADGTTTELFSTSNSGTSEVWTGASGAYNYTIMKAGLLPVRGSGASPTASITIDPQQKVDRAYVASSGLIMTGGSPNCSANTGTLKFGLTADSTLQNFYSYMIEQWISNTALRNQAFPIVPNGPSSFRFIDWTWDTDASIDHLSRDGMQYYNSGTSTATDIWAAILSVGVPAGMQVRYQQQDGLGTTNAQNTGNIDQLIKIKKTGAGAFDYTNWLVLKVQQEGYDQAEAVAVDIYGTLEDQLYVAGLTPLANGIAAQAGITGVTIYSEPTPVSWNGQLFSTTITDTTDAHTGLQIMQYVRSLNNFNLHDMIRANGAKFKTVTGNVYGDTLTTPAGVRVVKADGTTPHPDFDLFIADSGGSYVPDVVAPITWAGALNGTTVLLYNDSNAGALIDTQAVSGAGGYDWTISLPHVDVAVGDSLRLRFGHKEYYAGELQGTMTASGLTFVGAMTLHPVYAGWGLNGATYDQANGGPYTMDGANLQVDIAAGATTGLKTQLGAWTQYLMTLPAGLDAFYRAWDLLALNQIRQNVAVVNVMIDVPTAGALFTFTDNNVNYYRSDFTFPGNVQAGHGLIAMTYNAEPFVATVTGGNVVTGDQASMVAAIFSQAGVTPIPSDMKKTNGVTIKGDGTAADKFRSTLVA